MGFIEIVGYKRKRLHFISELIELCCPKYVYHCNGKLTLQMVVNRISGGWEGTVLDRLGEGGCWKHVTQGYMGQETRVLRKTNQPQYLTAKPLLFDAGNKGHSGAPSPIPTRKRWCIGKASCLRNSTRQEIPRNVTLENPWKLPMETQAFLQLPQPFGK